jgi:hypothetical protein
MYVRPSHILDAALNFHFLQFGTDLAYHRSPLSVSIAKSRNTVRNLSKCLDTRATSGTDAMYQPHFASTKSLYPTIGSVYLSHADIALRSGIELANLCSHTEGQFRSAQSGTVAPMAL